MKLRTIFIMLSITLMLTVTAYASPDTTQQVSTHSHGPMIKASGVNPPKHLITPPKTSYWYSTNWAGYAVNSSVSKVSNVKGSWIVPKVQTTSRNQYSANWIGIDGFNSGSVEQVGTDSDTDSKGRPVYYAWYEFYPDPCYIIPEIPVSDGDKITADVTFNPSQVGSNTGTYTVTITNTRTGATKSITSKTLTCDRSSAEWIVEAPWRGRVLPLTNFGTTSLGSYYTGKQNNVYTMNDATDQVISSTATNAMINSIDMISTNSKKTAIIKAHTEDLNSDGASFQVTWKRDS